MQIPHPKFLVPALFSIVAGIPMLLQTTMPVVDVPAEVISGAARTEVRDAQTNRDLRRQFFEARSTCLKWKAETERPFDCPAHIGDPNVEKFLNGKTPDTTTEESRRAAANDALEMDESALTHEEKHLLRRAVRLGSCSEMWKNISEAFYLLCNRTVSEMGSVRQDSVDDAMEDQNAGKLHSAAPLVEKLNQRIDALPKRAEVKRFHFRRNGTLDLGNE
jgi:hypothetical protein